MSGIPGFKQHFVKANGINLSVHTAGEGESLILLHGFPQNHMCWERIAPDLAKEFHCVIPDLRGYGDSDAPAESASENGYSKRSMANDIVAMMNSFGIERARFVGHDRGARVTYRLSLDYPERVDRLAIIEVVPTADLWAAWNSALALGAYHWTFLAQPPPLPERLIAADPAWFIDWTLSSWTASKSLKPFSEVALASYRKQAMDPNRISAMCWDYRAGAGPDRSHDEENRAAGRKIARPLHFVWSEIGFPSRTGDPMGIWRSWCDQATGNSLTGTGHFAMEENPDGVYRSIIDFLR